MSVCGVCASSEGQRTNYKSRFSPSIMWVPGIELKSSFLV